MRETEKRERESNDRMRVGGRVEKEKDYERKKKMKRQIKRGVSDEQER